MLFMNPESRKNNINIDVNIPIYSPRTTYNNIRHSDELLLADLALNFDPFTINILKNEFIIRKGELTLVEFVMILKEHLLNWQIDMPYRERKLIRCLKSLFEEIDLNGNGLLDWDEFTNYIIKKATVINNIKNKNEEIKNYTQIHLKLNKKFPNPITKCIYIKDIDRIAIVEEESDEIYLLNHETGVFNSKPLIVARPKIEPKRGSDPSDNTGHTPVTAEKSMILDMIYVSDAKHQFLITSSNDGAIRTWRYTSNGFVNAKEDDAIYFPQAQIKLAWDGINEILYTGQRDGIINIWDKKSERIIHTLEKDGHKDVIMDMIALPKLQLLASCSLDKSIILWNTIDNRKHREFKEHLRGVVSLAFNEPLILLISASIDHDIYIWNPYIANSIFKVSAHPFPLVGVRVIEGTNHFISLDTVGNLKVWDFKKFNCLQTMNLETNDEKHAMLPQNFTYIPKPLKLVISGRSLTFFEYDKNYNPNSVDETCAVNVCYVSQTMSILTPAGTKIKVWNGLTGEVKKIFSDLNNSEITAFALDEIKKRCLIGFANGEAGVYNIINGAKIKDLVKHNTEITFILEARNISCIITGSNHDGTIKLHTDKTITESENIRTMSIYDTGLTALVYESNKKMIITGTQAGTIAFWEAETGKVINQARAVFENEEITSICLIHNMNYILVSSSSGKIICMSKPSYSMNPTKVFTFYNYDIDNPHIPLFIHNMILCNKTYMLFLSDEKGFLKAYNIRYLFDEIDKDYQKKNKLEVDNNNSNHNGAILNFTKLQPPVIPKIEVNPLWISKAHLEPIKAIEYVQEENIIITSGLDKRVKLWCSLTGKFIDSLQQNNSKSDPIPIAMKKGGTDEIYTVELDKRVDLEQYRHSHLNDYSHILSYGAHQPYVHVHSHMLNLSHLGKNPKSAGPDRNDTTRSATTAGRQSKKDVNIPSLKFLTLNHDKKEDNSNIDSERHDTQHDKSGLLTSIREVLNTNNKDVSDIPSSVKDEDFKSKALIHNNMNSAYKRRLLYTRSEEEEFDPFYNYNLIDQNLLNQKESNKWKLHLNFQKHCKDFEEQIHEIIKDVENEEKRLEDSQKKETIKTHFNVKNYNENDVKDKFNLLDQEAENVKKQKELEELRKLNFKKIIQDRDKKSLTRNTNRKSVQPRKRIDHDLNQDSFKDYFTELSKKEPKGHLLCNSNNPAYLTKEEADAAYKLAAALSNYDKDDMRTLKLLDVKIRNIRQKRIDKDFIQQNKNILANFAGSTSLAAITNVPKLPKIHRDISATRASTDRKYK